MLIKLLSQSAQQTVILKNRHYYNRYQTPRGHPTAKQTITTENPTNTQSSLSSPHTTRANRDRRRQPRPCSSDLPG